MEKIILKNKHNEILGPFDLSASGEMIAGVCGAISVKQAELLGFGVEDYDPQTRCERWISIQKNGDERLWSNEQKEQYFSGEVKIFHMVELREGEQIVSPETLESIFKKAFGINDPSAYDKSIDGAPTVNDSNWAYWYKKLVKELEKQHDSSVR